MEFQAELQPMLWRVFCFKPSCTVIYLLLNAAAALWGRRNSDTASAGSSARGFTAIQMTGKTAACFLGLWAYPQTCISCSLGLPMDAGYLALKSCASATGSLCVFKAEG